MEGVKFDPLHHDPLREPLQKNQEYRDKKFEEYERAIIQHNAEDDRRMQEKAERRKVNQELLAKFNAENDKFMAELAAETKKMGDSFDATRKEIRERYDAERKRISEEVAERCA